MQLLLKERPPRYVDVDASGAEEGQVAGFSALDEHLVEGEEPGRDHRRQPTDSQGPTQIVGRGSFGARFQLRESAEIDGEHQNERRGDDRGHRRERPTHEASGAAPDPPTERTSRNVDHGRWDVFIHGTQLTAR